MLENQQALSRRERQIMDILYQRGSASAADVLAALPDPPSYSAVRALLKTLEGKGHIVHRVEGLKHVFVPCLAPAQAKHSALRHLLDTFFRNSPSQVVAALLDVSAAELTPDDLNRMAALIEKAKKEGR
ncbi:MAG: BlaI/MecI/CopY family transcriptional regulator [Acidobacteria bacterium]|nr:BlaI/MecI/CopY family transcriptional regulator [Acidobacteriota bacterium]